MSFQPTNNRRAFQLESLEIRNAPSHFGGLAHAVLAMHPSPSVAHVHHSQDAETGKKDSASSGVEEGQDAASNSGHNDMESKEAHGVDPKGDR